MTQGEKSTVNGWRLSVWEYLGEAILAILASVLLFLIFGRVELHDRLCGLRSDLMTAVGIALGVSATVWVGFFAMLSSEFGKWLRVENQSFSYSRALAAPIFANLVGLLLLVFSACSDSLPSLVIGVVVLVYDLINFVTMVRNVNGLVGLWETWQQNHKSQ